MFNMFILAPLIYTVIFTMLTEVMHLLRASAKCPRSRSTIFCFSIVSHQTSDPEKKPGCLSTAAELEMLQSDSSAISLLTLGNIIGCNHLYKVCSTYNPEHITSSIGVHFTTRGKWKRSLLENVSFCETSLVTTTAWWDGNEGNVHFISPWMSRW